MRVLDIFRALLLTLLYANSDEMSKIMIRDWIFSIVPSFISTIFPLISVVSHKSQGKDLGLQLT